MIPLIVVAALFATSVAAVALSRGANVSTLVYLATTVASAIMLVFAATHLLSEAAALTSTLPLGLPWLGAHFRVDTLSAFFLVVVNLGAASASLYAIGYGRHEKAPHRVLPFYPAFLAGMNLVVLADDAFTFLLSWELMSLASWALALSHHRVRDNTEAAYIYLVMAGFGTFCLLLAFGLLAGPTGNYVFDAIRSGPPSPTSAAFIVAFVLLGAGSKAGLVPLHVWLPLAHPAAPSHVSALMSGVMTKVAIYAFVRIVFELVGPPVWWWGVPLLLVGGATSVLGILFALMQRDVKRMLAYSTIENIGLIFVSLGLALAFKANAMQAAAALAMTAALFHVFNHSLFKSLLFFGSGAVLTATGERDMERLGGLIHRMPMTSLAVLVGCVAISALPPLNGFVSEWLTFQAILISPTLPQWVLRFSIPAVGALLALSAALAAACFVRAFGITFLGRPRSAAAEKAQEVDRYSLAAMFVVAGLCALVGILPSFAIDALAPAVAGLVGDRMPVQAAVPWLTITPIAESRSSYNGLLVFLFITISALSAAEIIHRFASRAVRRGPAWDCGFPDASPATQYTAGSFAQPIRRVFSPVFEARERVDMPAPGEMRPARLTITLRDFVWDLLYVRIGTAIRFATEKLNLLQFLTIRKYLTLVFVALIALLLRVSLWP